MPIHMVRSHHRRKGRHIIASMSWAEFSVLCECGWSGKVKDEPDATRSEKYVALEETWKAHLAEVGAAVEEVLV